MKASDFSSSADEARWIHRSPKCHVEEDHQSGSKTQA